MGKTVDDDGLNDGQHTGGNNDNLDDARARAHTRIEDAKRRPQTLPRGDSSHSNKSD